jgi:hypothetical protein
MRIPKRAKTFPRKAALPALPPCGNLEAPGEVAEWLNALVSKTGLRETVTRVRIPPSPF